ncbi:MAG: zinc ribbon domain-containing protein [Planctomycetia bacterium]|nr:zinc ribbon domain-containing protein [Planctomycetia bacterium]
MPTYSYKCDACGHEFEEIQSFHAPTKMKCPECGKKKANRVIGPCAGIVFKGTGFYETDYKQKGTATSK